MWFCPESKLPRLHPSMAAQPLVGLTYKSANDLGPTGLPLTSSPPHHMSQLCPALPVSRLATLLHTPLLEDVLNLPLRTLPSFIQLTLTHPSFLSLAPPPPENLP